MNIEWSDPAELSFVIGGIVSSGLALYFTVRAGLMGDNRHAIPRLVFAAVVAVYFASYVTEALEFHSLQTGGSIRRFMRTPLFLAIAWVAYTGLKYARHRSAEEEQIRQAIERVRDS